MCASIINLADYRRPKPPAVVTSVAAVPMLLPIMVSIEFHA
jgi:hypothetical protein